MTFPRTILRLLNHFALRTFARRIAALFIIIAALAPAFLLHHSALAQGTSGTLPDPISTQELMRYGDRLHLSNQQRQAASALHDEYKQQFRALREGEIAQFLSEVRSTETGTMPSRKAVEDIFKRMSALTRKIEAVDNSLFDKMQNLLTEEQQALMPRVRQARERARFSAQRMMWMGGAQQVDLSELLMEIDIADAERQTVDGLMAQYESALTSQMNRLYQATTRTMMDMFDALEQMGMADADMEDPESMEKFGQAMQQVWGDITKKSMELTGDIAELNRKTCKSVGDLLPAEAARSLRNSFYSRSYPEAGFVFGTGEGMFLSAMKFTELTDEQKTAIIATRDELRSKLDPLGQEMIDLLDERRNTMSPFEYDQEYWEKYQKKVGALQMSVNEAQQAAVTSLRAILGPELAEKVAGIDTPDKQKKAMAALSVTEPAAEEIEPGVDVSAEESDAPQAWGGDQFLPPAITQRELAEYVRMLGLGPEQEAVIEDLHTQYNEAFARFNATELKTLQTAQQSMWQYDQETNKSTPPTNDAIDHIYQLRSRALLAALAVDNQFFDDVAAAVLAENQADRLDRVKNARARMVHNRSQYYVGVAYGGSAESSIDLSRLVRSLRLSDADLAVIDAGLADYEEKATEAFRQRYEAALGTNRAQEKWNAEAMAAQAEGGNGMAIASRYQATMGAAQTKLREACDGISQLNRKTVDDLATALPSTAAQTLRSAFNRKAFPEIFNDPGNADSSLQSASRLGDVTEEQRRMINDFAAEFHPAYMSLCDQMVLASDGASAYFGASFTQDDWKEWQERQELLSKLTFDRNELCARTVRKLRTIMTEPQIERLGGLPDPTPQDNNPWD